VPGQEVDQTWREIVRKTVPAYPGCPGRSPESRKIVVVVVMRRAHIFCGLQNFKLSHGIY